MPAPSSDLATRIAYAYDVRYRFNPWAVARDEEVDLLLPLPSGDAYQSVARLDVSHEGARLVDPRGNVQTLLRVRRGQPVGFSAALTTRGFRLGQERLTVPDPIPQDREPAPLIPLDDEVSHLAVRLTRHADDDEQAARRLFAYVRDTIRYRYPPPARGAVETLRRGSGDCGEYAVLLTALCRAVGIPARPVFGWLVAPLQQTPHVWTELWLDRYGWVPADANLAREIRFWAPFLKVPPDPEYLFGNLDPYRLALSRGTGLDWPGADVEPERRASHLLLPMDGEPVAVWQDLHQGKVPYLQLPYLRARHPQPAWRLLTSPYRVSARPRVVTVPPPAALATAAVQRTWWLWLAVDVATRLAPAWRERLSVALVLALWSAVLAFGATRMATLPRGLWHRLLWSAAGVGWTLAALAAVAAVV